MVSSVFGVDDFAPPVYAFYNTLFRFLLLFHDLGDVVGVTIRANVGVDSCDSSDS